MIRLKFWNTCDLVLEDGSGIVFTDSSGNYSDFYCLVFIQPLIDIGYPKYEVLQEATEDGYAQQQINFQKWNKRYSMTFIADEPFLDGMTIIPLCDNVWLTNPVTDVEYKIRDVVFSEPTWNNGIATITMEWSIQSILKTNCCNNIPLNCEECSVNIGEIAYVRDCKFQIRIETTCTEGWATLYYRLPGETEYEYYDTAEIEDLKTLYTLSIDENPCPDGVWAIKVVIGNHSCDNAITAEGVEKA
jgi:hypothetical protein